MGTCAVDSVYWVSATSTNDGETKKIMVQSAKKTIALASGNKLSQTESFKVCDISQVDTLITDLDSNDSDLNDFRKLNIEIV